MRDYEFHIYAATEDGDVSINPKKIERMSAFDDKSAIRVARLHARKAQAPVDLARSGPMTWNDRYVGTAMPKYPGSSIPSKATLFERLD